MDIPKEFKFNEKEFEKYPYKLIQRIVNRALFIDRHLAIESKFMNYITIKFDKMEKGDVKFKITKRNIKDDMQAYANLFGVSMKELMDGISECRKEMKKEE